MEILVFILFWLATVSYFFIHTKSLKNFFVELIFFIFIGLGFFVLIFGNSVLQKYSEILQPSPAKEKIVDLEAPKITILYPKDGEVFGVTTKNIQVSVQVSDTVDPNPEVKGDGNFTLEKGFNSIVVTAIDASGNVSSDYLVVEKK